MRVHSSPGLLSKCRISILLLLTAKCGIWLVQYIYIHWTSKLRVHWLLMSFFHLAQVSEIWHNNFERNVLHQSNMWWYKIRNGKSSNCDFLPYTYEHIFLCGELMTYQQSPLTSTRFLSKLRLQNDDVKWAVGVVVGWQLTTSATNVDVK